MELKIDKEELRQDKADVRKARFYERFAEYMQDKKEMMLAPWSARPVYYGARAVFFWIDAVIYTAVLMNLTNEFVGESWQRGVLCLVIMYVVPLVARIYIIKLLRKKSDEIYEQKRVKYLAIRNKYVADSLTELGYVRTSSELEDCVDEVWTNSEGQITKMIQNDFVACSMHEYMNFEYIVVGQLAEFDLNDKKTKRADKHATISHLDKYNGKAVERVTLGVREFDELYDVYTVDEVKARTYLSSVIVDRLIKNKDSIVQIFEAGFEIKDDTVSFKMFVRKWLHRGANFRGMDIPQYISNAEEFVAGIAELDKKIDAYTFLVKGVQ